jgi:hypothetical protein
VTGTSASVRARTSTDFSLPGTQSQQALLDAFVVRRLLLPAVLELLGHSTWAFPTRLGHRLPRLATEPEPELRP